MRMGTKRIKPPPKVASMKTLKANRKRLSKKTNSPIKVIKK